MKVDAPPGSPVAVLGLGVLAGDITLQGGQRSLSGTADVRYLRQESVLALAEDPFDDSDELFREVLELRFPVGAEDRGIERVGDLAVGAFGLWRWRIGLHM